MVHEVEGDDFALGQAQMASSYAPRCASTRPMPSVRSHGRSPGRAATPLTLRMRFSLWGKAWMAQAMPRALNVAWEVSE